MESDNLGYFIMLVGYPNIPPVALVRGLEEAELIAERLNGGLRYEDLYTVEFAGLFEEAEALLNGN